MPGVVDEDAGIAVSSANLGWRDLPLRELLAERLRLPVVIGHDVRAGALAEARLGAGRGCPVFSFIAVGTGIAAAVVIDGTVLRGAHGAAGELGHLIVRPDGLECVCGQRGCVETVASASAIARRYEQSGGDPVSAERIAARAADSEPLAAEVWTEAVAALADGLVANQALFDPEVVAIGGGLARAGEQLFAPLRGAVRVRLTFHAMPQIVPAQLGYLAGCQGAGLLAFDALPSSDDSERRAHVNAANATAAAVATFSESTSPAIGIRTCSSDRARAASVKPGPSAPSSTAQRGGTATDRNGTASARGVRASSRKPARRTESSESGQPPASTANGSRST